MHVLLVDMHELQIAEPEQANQASRREMRHNFNDDECECGQHQLSTVYEPSKVYAEEETKTQKRKRDYGEKANNTNYVDADTKPVGIEKASSEVKSHEGDNSEDEYSPSVLVKHREETESGGSRRIITVKRRGGTYQIENNLFKLFVLVSRC
jgi:hypothetical protein